jgi:hypothetical protein
MEKTETLHLPEVIRARREDIAGQAECAGCGTTLEECKRLAAANTDPTAPPWFGCCAMGTAMGPCDHRPNSRLLNALLKEIETGTVESVEAVIARREAKAAERAARRADATPPGHAWPLSYADMFGQAEWWKTRDQGWIKVIDMADSHRANTVRFLERRAATVAYRVSRSEAMLLGDAPDDVQDDLHRVADERREDPAGWLRNTPLVKAMKAGLTIDARTDDLMAEQTRKDTLADHPFGGLGRTCGHPIEGTGDDFIRCGRPDAEHPIEVHR